MVKCPLLLIQTSYYHSYIDNRINVGGGRTKSICKTDIILKALTVTFSVLWHLVCGAQLSGEQQLIALKLSKLYFQSLSEQCNLK